MVFLLAGVAVNMAQVLGFVLIFFCNLSSVDPYGWIALSTTSLVTFIFFRGLGLGLGLTLTCINKREIVARCSLIIPTKFILLGGPMTYWAPGVDFLGSYR